MVLSKKAEKRLMLAVAALVVFSYGVRKVKADLSGDAKPVGFNKITGADETLEADVITRQNQSRLTVDSTITGSDTLGAERTAQVVVRNDGVRALSTDGRVVVESTFGFDQNPDSWFRVINTGLENDTITINLAAITNDPTVPSRNIPAYSKVFTILASEVGDELKLRDRIIQELNQDSVFRNTQLLKAGKATDRGVVHIYSEAFSASGEFYERPNAGDFDVVTTGSAQVFIGFDNIISRSKPVTIARDLDSPHRLGLFGITGSVNVTAKALSDIFVAEALNGGSPDMDVNGSGTPVVFEINAEVEKEIFIEELIFDGQGNGIRFGRFLNLNSSLSNCIAIEIKSDNLITNFPDICTTEDFKNKWAALGGNGANFRIDVQSGADEMLAILSFPNPFLIRQQGTFTTDDYIRVTIRDNITQVARLNFRAKGFEKDP
jgi:hypothetical protein